MRTTEQKENLLRIEKMRLLIIDAFDKGILTEKDIFNLTYENINFGCKKTSQKNYVLFLLKNIYNCPFLLCDIDILSDNVKRVIPSFLLYRYEMELDILDERLNDGSLSEEEFDMELNNLNFYYYQFSKDGRQIIKERQNKASNSKKI